MDNRKPTAPPPACALMVRLAEKRGWDLPEWFEASHMKECPACKAVLAWLDEQPEPSEEVKAEVSALLRRAGYVFDKR